MDDIRLISEASSAILKPVRSPLTGSLTTNRQQTDSTSLIQQSDVSSSRPALLAHDALGPLLFEVCKICYSSRRSYSICQGKGNIYTLG
jgi:hypothetical protein